ncbi:hypothetical protein FVEN_g12473 [Fusarium venenatum]|nr:hypothetical protein FVEN_g12473 [Fusarium venenatum]
MNSPAVNNPRMYLPALCNLLATQAYIKTAALQSAWLHKKNVSSPVPAADYQHRIAWSRRITVRCHSNPFAETSAKRFEELYGISTK